MTYYLSNQEGKDFLVYSLFIPVILGALVVWRSFVGIGQAYDLQQEMLAEKIESSFVPIDVLVGFLQASIFLDYLVCICLIILFFESPLAIFTPHK